MDHEADLIMPRRAVRVLHCTRGTSNKLYIVRVDHVGQKYRLVASYGKATASHLNDHLKLISDTLAQALSAMHALCDDKKSSSHYDDVLPYQNYGVSITAALKKIDTSRIEQLVQSKPLKTHTKKPAAVAAAAQSKQPAEPGPIRRKRRLTI